MTEHRTPQDGRGTITITSEHDFQAFGPAGFTREEERKLFQEGPAQARSFGDTIRDLIGSGVSKAGEAVGGAIDEALRGFASARAPARTGTSVLRFPSGYPSIEIGPDELAVYKDVLSDGGRIPVRYVHQDELRELTGRGKDEEVYGAAFRGRVYVDRALAERHGQGEVQATKVHEIGHFLYPRAPEGPVEVAGYVASLELADDGDPTVSHRARQATAAFRKRYGSGIDDLADQITWRAAA